MIEPELGRFVRGLAPPQNVIAGSAQLGDDMQTLVERLRTDFGRKTLGELIQDREAAALEIERLHQELARCRSVQLAHPKPPVAATAVPTARPRIELGIQRDGRELLRLKDVCEIVGLSRSTIYLAMTTGSFPKAVQVGARAVRWRSSDISAWVASKGASSAMR
jgi:prophage regulatory protein